jgi:uncharacterized damage-inducible protein DinB
MTLAQSFLAELKHESTATKKMFERLPFDKSEYKPHEKSMALLRLATHIAEMPLWLAMTITTDGMDITTTDYKPYVPKNNEDLLNFFDENLKKVEDILNNCSDEEMLKSWTMKSGDNVIFSMPKVSVIRGMIMNHSAHHRGQLSVYFRLLDIPVPGTYGPTADEK